MPDIRFPLLKERWIDRWKWPIVLTAFVAWGARELFLSTDSNLGKLVLLIGLLVTTGICLRLVWENVRFQSSCLVLDEQGVAILESGRRRGLPWAEIADFEWESRHLAEVLRLIRKEGDPLDLRLPRNTAVQTFVVTSYLDRFVRSLDRTTVPALPTNVVGLRLAQHLHRPPPVELEPGVHYRYANPEVFREAIGMSRMLLLTLAISASVPAWTVLALVAPNPYWIRFLGPILILLGVGYKTIDDVRLLRALKDRFTVRDGTIFIVRNGQTIPLGEGRPSPRQLLFQPLTDHGSRLFPYRTALQFLEPDVPPSEVPGG